MINFARRKKANLVLNVPHGIEHSETLEVLKFQ